MHDQCGHIELLEVLSEVGLGKCLECEGSLASSLFDQFSVMRISGTQLKRLPDGAGVDTHASVLPNVAAGSLILIPTLRDRCVGFRSRDRVEVSPRALLFQSFQRHRPCLW